MRRITINDKREANGLELIATAYLDVDKMRKGMGKDFPQVYAGAKGGGRNVDDMIRHANACVIVETDDCVLGFGRF